MKRLSEPQFQEELEHILARLQNYQPDKVILFGSFARGDHHGASDVDLIIIKETDQPFVERIGQVLRLCDSRLPLEPLVYTPAEVAQMLERGNAFLSTALREGRVVYDSAIGGESIKENMGENNDSPSLNRHREEAMRWLRQGEYDFQAAQMGSEHGFHALCCFLCQQAAEKALKAFLYAQGERMVYSHSTYELVRQCAEYRPDFAGLTDLCAELDQFYISTRYPNGLPGGVPHEVYTSRQAARALADGQQVISAVRRLFEKETQGSQD